MIHNNLNQRERYFLEWKFFVRLSFSLVFSRVKMKDTLKRIREDSNEDEPEPSPATRTTTSGCLEGRNGVQ